MDKIDNELGDIATEDDDVLFHMSGRTALYVIQIIFNFTIVTLMSANIQFVTKFQKLTYSMVNATLIFCFLGVIADFTDVWYLEEILFKVVKCLFIVFNYGICYQLNDSLNHGPQVVTIVLILIICGIFGPLVLYRSWKGTYVANIILSIYSLKLLYEIKSKATSKGGSASMQLLSMVRLELIILVLNVLVWAVNMTGIWEYEDPAIWGAKSCIWLLFLLKMYILTVYFSGDSNYGNKSRPGSRSDIQYGPVSEKDDDVVRHDV